MRNTKIVLFLAFSLLGVSWSWGQNSGRKTNVAVLAFAGDNNVNPAQLDFITSKFVGELISLDVFNVLDRGKMDYILQEQGFQQSGACSSTECKVEMGQLLGMDYIISGYLVRFGKSYALSIEYTDLGTGRIVKTFDDRKSGELDEIYEELCHSVAVKLVQFADPNVTVVTPVKPKPTVAVVPVEPQPQVAPQPTPAPQVNYKPEPVTTKPLSWGKKIAIGLIIPSFGGVGAGVYSDFKMRSYISEADHAIENNQRELSYEALGKANDMQKYRNISNGVSIGSAVLLLGLLLFTD